MITLTIPGVPIAKERHRTVAHDRWGRPLKKVRTYNPQREAEEIVRMHIQAQLGTQLKEPLKGAVVFYAIFYMPIPLSWPEAKRKRALRGEEYHLVKPDFDNLIKFYADVLEKTIYINDKQIVKGIAEKKYSENPRTEILIERKEG